NLRPEADRAERRRQNDEVEEPSGQRSRETPAEEEESRRDDHHRRHAGSILGVKHAQGGRPAVEMSQAGWPEGFGQVETCRVRGLSNSGAESAGMPGLQRPSLALRSDGKPAKENHHWQERNLFDERFLPDPRALLPTETPQRVEVEDDQRRRK